jgi:hypothetical protein
MGIFDGIKAGARTLAAKLRLKPRPGMIGSPPSARRMAAIPTNPTDHAVQFAREWADRLELYVEGRMHALDIPERQIGHGDPDYGIPWRVFFPHGTTGGSVIGQRIGVNSGVLNPDLLINPYGPKAAEVWAKSRLRDRIDAVVAHEQQEGLGLSHEEAVRGAADTLLAITDGARRILRAIAYTERER